MLEVAISHRFADATIDIAFRSEARSIALFGDSGAGKTSVLDAISGLLTPDTGTIALDDEVWFDRARSINIPIRRRAVGYVFQDGRLFPHLSVRANLLYGTHGRPHSDHALDGTVELLNLESLLPRRPDTLSGGERQRVAIGRALLSEPRVLLLDEPLTGLHRSARADVLGHLQRLRERQTITMVLVSHQPAEVIALADEVVLIADGMVVETCTVSRFESQRTALD